MGVLGALWSIPNLARGQKNFVIIWLQKNQKGFKTQQDDKWLWNNGCLLSQSDNKDLKGKYRSNHLKGKEI